MICLDLTSEIVSIGLKPEFSASAKGTVSKLSANACIAYCSMDETCKRANRQLLVNISIHSQRTYKYLLLELISSFYYSEEPFIKDSKHYVMLLCYVMLCYVMLCYVMLCYVMLCYVMLSYVMSCYVMLLCYVMLCYVMLCYVMLCYVKLCYVMSCYVMLLCYVMLCYVMSCHVM